MKKRNQVLAWTLTLSLLFSGAALPAALADGTTYVWVSPLLGIGAASTITVDAVTIGEKTPAADVSADKVWFNSGDAVVITYTDTVAGNTYVYDVSLDGGTTFSLQGLSAGDADKISTDVLAHLKEVRNG